MQDSRTHLHVCGQNHTVVGQPLSIGAYPFLQSDLEGPKHPADIPLRGLITVSIDHCQMGVGGEHSWGMWPRPQHLIKAEQRSRL